MSVDESKSEGEVQALTLAAAGQMAGGVAQQLAVPLRELRENLAFITEMLDRHILDSGGPVPYPWENLKSLRERVAQSYLVSRKVARLTSDLANAITTFDKRPESVDVNKLVEVAINLTRHRLGASTEVFVDLARLPMTRVVPGALVLALDSVDCCSRRFSARSARRCRVGEDQVGQRCAQRRISSALPSTLPTAVAVGPRGPMLP